MVPEDDRDMQQGLNLDPASVITASDPESPDPAAPEYQGATDADSALAEPGVAGVTDAGSPSAVVPADAEPEPTRASPVASDADLPAGCAGRPRVKPRRSPAASPETAG